MAKYKEILVAWDPKLGEWYFQLDRPGFRTIGFTGDELYFDDQDSVILNTAKAWLKSIDKDLSGFRISLIRPDSPNKGQTVNQLIKLRIE